MIADLAALVVKRKIRAKLFRWGAGVPLGVDSKASAWPECYLLILYIRGNLQTRHAGQAQQSPQKFVQVLFRGAWIGPDVRR